MYDLNSADSQSVGRIGLQCTAPSLAKTDMDDSRDTNTGDSDNDAESRRLRFTSGESHGLQFERREPTAVTLVCLSDAWDW